MFWMHGHSYAQAKTIYEEGFYNTIYGYNNAPTPQKKPPNLKLVRFVFLFVIEWNEFNMLK